MPWLLILPSKGIGTGMGTQPHLSFFSANLIGLGMEKAESQLMLKLSFGTVAVKLGILANLCPVIFGVKISVLIFCFLTNWKNESNS